MNRFGPPTEHKNLANLALQRSTAPTLGIPRESVQFAAEILLRRGFPSTRRSAPRARGQGGKSLTFQLQE